MNKMTDLNVGRIDVCGVELSIGEEYEEANSALLGKVYAQNMDNNGLGHIILKDTEFGGLLGSCTVYFSQNRLKEFVFKPEWNKYSLQDANGDRMPIDKATQVIANTCFEKLKKDFGQPIEEEANRKIRFIFAGKFEIEATVDRYGENFYIVLR